MNSIKAIIPMLSIPISLYYLNNKSHCDYINYSIEKEAYDHCSRFYDEFEFSDDFKKCYKKKIKKLRSEYNSVYA
jgi:hypothetical protein